MPDRKVLADGSFSFVANSADNVTPERILLILVYEIGKLIEYRIKAQICGESGYYSVANQQKEMADVISMVRMYCEMRGWNFEELMKYGEDCYMDRMDDIRQYGQPQSRTGG